MINVLLIIYYMILIITAIYSLYFSIISVIGLIKRNKNNFKKTKKKNKFAILIPARNEEIVIGNLIDSLKMQNYPKDKYEIYVIPNNCTDKTESISKKMGAKIIKCNVKTKTKGDVLNYVFKEFSSKKNIDCYAIFDADNIVHPDFLTHINDALESGFNVAQGHRDAKNISDSWISGSYSIYYLVQNVYFYTARMNLGTSATINGTGFAVKKEYIDNFGFETYSLTEDIEYSGQCALRGEKIAYVKDAITYDEYPTSFKVSWKQRKRWSSGMIECMKLYSFKLIKKIFSNFSAFDIGLLYLGPLIQLLNFINIVVGFILKIYGVALNDIFNTLFLSGIYSFLISMGFCLFIEIFALRYKTQRILPALSGIIFFPLFIVTWLPINVYCFIKKQTKWEEIKHTRAISIKDKIS